MTTRVSRAMTSPLPSPNHARAIKTATTMKAVKELLLNPEVQDYLALDEENTALKETNKILEADVESRDRRIATLLSKADENEKQAANADAKLDKLEKEKTALSSKLTAAHSELKETQHKMASRDAQRVKELEKLKKELQAESDKLQKLRSFSMELMPTARRQEEIKSRLGELFSSARTLAEDHFCIDLPPQILLDDVLWKNIKEYLKGRNAVPLPLSNSLVAKQMRTGAFLAVLLHEMSAHIFQSTYLLRDTAGLKDIMDDPDGEDELEWEAHLRSVFFRFSKLFPENSDTIAASNVDRVVTNVAACVLDLIPEKLKPSFKGKLKAFCTQACEHWKFIQQLDGKISLDFDADEANPFITTTFASTKSPNPSPDPPPKPARPNGTTSTQKKPTTTTTTMVPETLEDPVVIWPAFYNQSIPKMETLVRGHLLTAAQVVVAKAEEKAQQPTGPRRAHRQNSRTSRSYSVSMVGNSGSLNGSSGMEEGQDGSVTGSGSFLSQGSGGGRKGTS